MPKYEIYTTEIMRGHTSYYITAESREEALEKFQAGEYDGTPDGDIYRFNIDKVYDENMNDIKIARHPEQVIKIKFDKYIPKDSMMRKVVL